MSKSVDQMTDSEVLAAVGDMGPAFVGEELHARAERIRRDNPGGVLGPAFVDTKVEAPKAKKSAKAKE